MPDAPEVPSAFGGLRFWRKWAESLRFARLEHIRSAHGDWRTRVRGLGPVRRPVFVLGSPRSGTTYLGSLLAALPDVTYFYEPPVMKYYARLVFEGSTHPMRVRRFYRFGFHTLLAAAPGNGPRIVEKNPNHTWIAEDLLDVFPDAQFIMIVRDGRDTALSLLEKPWHRSDSVELARREPGGYTYGPFPHFYIEPDRAREYEATSDLHRCIWIWRRHTEEIERLNTVLPPRSRHEIRYETLLESPEVAIDGLLRFLREETAEARSAMSAAAETGHRNSIGRWRSIFTSDELASIEEEAGPVLRRLGYA